MKFCIALRVLLFALIIAEVQIFVKHDATGNLDGTSDLQDAIDEVVPGVQIWIATGTYLPDGPTRSISHFITLKAHEIFTEFKGKERSLNDRE